MRFCVITRDYKDKEAQSMSLKSLGIKEVACKNVSESRSHTHTETNTLPRVGKCVKSACFNANITS